LGLKRKVSLYFPTIFLNISIKVLCQPSPAHQNHYKTNLHPKKKPPTFSTLSPQPPFDSSLPFSLLPWSRRRWFAGESTMLPYKTVAQAEVALNRTLTFAETLWLNYSADKSDYLLYCHNILFLFMIFSLAPLPLVLIELIRSYNFEKYKIQPKVKLSFSEMMACYKTVMKMFFFVVGPLQLVSYPSVKVRNFDFDLCFSWSLCLWKWVNGLPLICFLLWEFRWWKSCRNGVGYVGQGQSFLSPSNLALFCFCFCLCLVRNGSFDWFWLGVFVKLCVFGNELKICRNGCEFFVCMWVKIVGWICMLAALSVWWCLWAVDYMSICQCNEDRSPSEFGVNLPLLSWDQKLELILWFAMVDWDVLVWNFTRKYDYGYNFCLHLFFCFSSLKTWPSNLLVFVVVVGVELLWR